MRTSVETSSCTERLSPPSWNPTREPLRQTDVRTTFEDVVVGHTRFTMADDVILQATDLGVRASFIKITGDIGKDAGRTFVSIEYSENPMAVHEIYPANECREDPLDEVLWFAPLDPGRNYTLTIIRTGKLAAWSTFNVAVYFSAWWVGVG